MTGETSEKSDEQMMFNPNLAPFEFQLTKSNEDALIEFGNWWDGKLLADGREIAGLPSVKALKPRFGFGRGLYTLVTHHTSTEKGKEGIKKLGGIIYLPDSEQTLFYGDDAGKQLQATLGVKKTGHVPYGEVKDGRTFVYLHPLPPELNEDAKVYLEGPDGFAFAKAFSKNPPDYNRSKFNLEQVLQAPWVAPDAWLTTDEGVKKMKQYLPAYSESLSKNPRLAYRMRMIENRYLLAVV